MRRIERSARKRGRGRNEKGVGIPAMLAIFMLGIGGIVWLAMYCQRLIGAFLTGEDLDDLFNFGA